MDVAAETVSQLGEASVDDRRGHGREPRRSWASPAPFQPRVTAHNVPEVVARSWRRTVRGYRRVAVAGDVVVVAAVAVPTLHLTYGRGVETAALVVAALCAYVAVVAVAGGYRKETLGEGPAETAAIARAGALAVLALVVASYVTKAEVSRLLVLLVLPSVTLLDLLWRWRLRHRLRGQRARGRHVVRAVVIGEPGPAAAVVRDLAAVPESGYRVLGVCVPDVAGGREEVAGVPVVGAICDVAQVVVDRAVDMVVVAGSYMSPDGLRRLSWALDRAGAQLTVAPNLLEVAGPRLTVRPTASSALLEVEIGATRARRIAKSVMDRVLGLAMLVAAAPVIAAAVVAVRLDSPGRAIYRQTRVGVDGRPFTLHKIRTMYVDADDRRRELLAASDTDGLLFKLRRDPRVTRVGQVLRKYSLDELPQLWNVVRGDMSLVGPRPPLAEEVAAYDDAVQRRLRVRPGLTGLWQVSGRSDLPWQEAVRLDLRYVDNWSLSMDLLILWKTVRAVLRPTGAY